MSLNYSNTYAARVFAEHPIGLWSLDDPIYFRSLLNTTELFVENWTILDENGEWDSLYITPLNLPISLSSRGVLNKNLSASVVTVEIQSASISYTNLDTSKDTIALGGYVYEYGDLVEGYEIGFKYSDGTIDSYETNSIGSGWQELVYTSNIVNSASSVIGFIKINYTPGGGGSEEDYKIMFNSLSIGQWSEPYITKNSGSIPEEFTNVHIQSILPITSYSMITLDAYGFNDEDYGMVIVDNNKLLAYNSNLSMVYGSENLTNILSPITEGMPSLLVPGKGFMNQNGKYSNLTCEFWIRVNPTKFINKKIFGPINSSDGLYIDGEYLTLVIGKYQKSYFVGKWYRPMLIDIRYSTTIVSLLINGDVVIEIDIDINDLDLPSKIYDWLAFYGSEDINPFELDCIVIYPYIVPDQLAKKRFIYAQGVQNAELIASNFDGQSVYIDFPFAQYTATLNYPDMVPWNAGYFNNIEANNKYIGFKQYELPEFKFSGNLEQIESPLNPRYWSEYQQRTWLEILSFEWQGISQLNVQEPTDIMTDNFLLQSASSTPFFKIRPNSAYDNVNGSIEFDSINVISDRVASIYGIFQAQDTFPSGEEQILMHFYNSINNNNFDIAVGENEIRYYYNDQLLNTASVNTSQDFAAGIDIDVLTINYPTILGSFFSNPQNISLSLMGYQDNTFLGKLYSLTFNNKFFNDKDTSDLFDTNGFAINTFNSDLFDYVGAYTLKPIVNESSMLIDACVAGYWEDHIPLSYFGKQITSKSGLKFYDLDMIQFNIEYPSDILVNSSSSVSYYEDVNVHSYITLQSFDQIGKIPYSRYTNTVSLASSKVLDFDNTQDVIETKFEVADGTIIFPPKELVDFKDYYITIHLEAKVEGISSKNLQLKRMILSSVANDEKDFFSINTRTGSKVYPISRYDKTYSYKDKNPYMIYQDSTPYLYLTGDSGVSLLPYNTSAQRSFSIPINNSKNDSYILGGVQFWGMYNDDKTINSVKNIGRISTPDTTYDMYLEPIDDGKRGKIQLYDAETGLVSDFINVVNDDVVYYQNGIRVKNPIIYPMQWTSIIIVFGKTISLPAVSGQLELNQGMIYNNIAIYEKSSSILGLTVGTRTWQEIRISEIVSGEETLFLENQWEDWEPYQWNGLSAPQEAITFSLNGSNINGSFLGTSTIISEDSSILEINSDGADIFPNVVWNTTFVKPI